MLYPSVCSTMSSGKRTLDQQPPVGSKRHRQTHEGGGGTMAVFAPPPGRVLLRRVYFMNNEKSKYVSVGIIPLAITRLVSSSMRPEGRLWY
jgi:hypothetical protein